MKSLRTDDIIGAMPRVRHMPKNLYRDHQSYPYRHSVEDLPIKDYETYYKNIGGKWDHSYNQNIYGNFPLSQYDPNPIAKRPIVPSIDRTRNNLQREQPLNQSQQYREKQYQDIYERPQSYKIGEGKNQTQNNPQSQYIQPKQAVFINYDQLKHFQNVSKDQNLFHPRKSSQDYIRKPQSSRITNQIPNQNPERNDLYSNTKQQYSLEINTKPNSRLEQGNQSQKSQQNQSSRSMRSSQSKDKVQKNIFRGLGFNIITNSKYLYNVESFVPYSKKEN